MFKNNYYKKNEEIIIEPKRAEKHDLKTVKPNVNNRSIVENDDR